MYKNLKRFLTIFMVFLMWTQVGYAMHGEEESETGATFPKKETTLEQEARERQAKYQKTRDILGLGPEHRPTTSYKKSPFSNDEDDTEKYITYNPFIDETEHPLSLTATQEAARQETARALQEEFRKNIAQNIDLTKSMNEQESDIDNKLNNIPANEYGYFHDSLIERIQSLTTAEKILSLDPSYIKYLKTTQLTPDLIAKLSSNQIIELTPDQIKELTPGQIKELTPTQIKVLTITQLQAFEPAQIEALTIAQFEALDDDKIKKLTKDKQNQFYIAFVKVLTPNDISELDFRGFKNFTSDQIKTFESAQIKAFTSKQLQAFESTQLADFTSTQIAAFNPDQITAFTPEQIKAFNPTQIAAFTSGQLQALCSKPDLVSALSPDQVKAINSTALAKAIEGDTLSNLRNKIKSNHLPENFVDALSDAQAAAIMDMHEKSKGRFFDSNDLKYFFSESQIKQLENKAKAAKGDLSEKVAQARNIIIKLVDQNLLDPTIVPGSKQDKERIALKTEFDASMSGLSIEEKQQVADEYTDAITKEEAKWFRLKKHLSKNQKDLITDLKNQLNTFIENYITPSLTNDEFAFEYTDPKTKKSTIKIIRVADLTPEQIKALTAGQIDALKDDQIAAFSNAQGNEFTSAQKTVLTTNLMKTLHTNPKDINIGNSKLSKLREITQSQVIKDIIQDIKVKYFYITLEDTTPINWLHIKQNIIPKLSEEQLAFLIKNAKSEGIKQWATNKINDRFIKNTVKFPAEYIKDILPSTISELTDDQIKALTTDQIAAITDEQIKTLTTEQLNALKDNLAAKSLEDLQRIVNETDVTSLKTICNEIIADKEKSTAVTSTVLQESFKNSNNTIAAAQDQQEKLISQITPANESEITYVLVGYADEVTSEISQSVDQIKEERQKSLDALSLEENAAREEIQKAYKELSLELQKKIEAENAPKEKVENAKEQLAEITQAATALTQTLPDQVGKLADASQNEQRLLTEAKVKAKTWKNKELLQAATNSNNIVAAKLKLSSTSMLGMGFSQARKPAISATGIGLGMTRAFPQGKK